MGMVGAYAPSHSLKLQWSVTNQHDDKITDPLINYYDRITDPLNLQSQSKKILPQN